VFSAADLIESLLHRRRLKSIRPDVPGQLPAGWQAWLDAMPARRGAVTGAPPESVIAVLLERPLRERPARMAQLDRWQAFATLWRQQWQPRAREERGQHWLAVATSTGIHLCFALLLLWLGYVQLMARPPAAEGDVVQVEFVGRGTPEEEGGGAPAAEQPLPQPTEPAPAAAAAAPSAAPAAAEPERVAEAAPSPEPLAAPEVAPPQPAPPAAQPVQVTEVAVPDSDYLLPPPTPRAPELAAPVVRVPDLQETPDTLAVEVPRVTAPIRRPELVQRAIEVPELREQVRTIEVPQRMAQARALQPAPTEAPRLQVPELRTQPGTLQIRERGEAEQATASSRPGEAEAPSSTQGRDAAPAGGPPATSSGTRPGAIAAGSGAAPTPRPGAWPTVPRGDDWGAASRNRPGGQPGASGERPGLFDADGTPRLADAPAPGRNAPGTVEQNVADLDRAGTWLKRPPYDYTPTMFDRFWVPHETLLQEWVRKGIKAVSIPIPGTDKRLSCVVSMLQLGGGCGLVDPNVNEQPATARPPPDIPFKPHLQEDNGSAPPSGG
jgi:hypothetical protein